VQKAKTMIQNTVIGIVLFGTMILIGNWLIPGGVFGGDITNNGNGKSEGGGTSEGGETSGESSSQAPTKASDTITIATWNIKFNNSTANIKSGAKKIANSGADLIGFQELNFPASRKAIQDGLIDCKGCDYSGYFPGGSGESGWDNRATVSLVWNKSKFEKLDQNSESVSNADAAANTGAKWINWVKLKDIKTGTIFYFANTHFVAEVRQKSSNSQIKQNYYHHLDELIGFIKDIKEPVIIAGDFNMAYNYDKANDHAYDGRSYSPLRRLNKYDIYSNWQYAKKSTMSIDYIWASKRDEVQFVSTKKWSSKMGSDHSPATMTLKLYEEE
jgi:endonuclease/exonuclease/phosphatase family metal-dependent hydrolase